MEILRGDALVVIGHDPIDRVIEFVTHGGPSHVAMFISPEVVAEAQFGRPIGEQTVDFYLNSGARLEVWGDPLLTEEDRVSMVDFAKTMYGAGYDTDLIPLELARFLFGTNIEWYHEHQKKICSRYLYCIALHQMRLWAKVENCAPVDLLNTHGGALVRKGVLTKEGLIPV